MILSPSSTDLSVARTVGALRLTDRAIFFSSVLALFLYLSLETAFRSWDRFNGLFFYLLYFLLSLPSSAFSINLRYLPKDSLPY